MLLFHDSLQVWGTSTFEAVFKQELAQQAAQLPLQQALSRSSAVADTPPTVLIRSVNDAGDKIGVRVGVFYEGVVGGCSCADDPTPDSVNTEYCEVLLAIDKVTGVAALTLEE